MSAGGNKNDLDGNGTEYAVQEKSSSTRSFDEGLKDEM
jgi:hypothetical protein